MSEVTNYAPPMCVVVALQLEGQILSISGSLNDMNDNSIYSEDF